MSKINNKVCYIVGSCKDFCDKISFHLREEDIIIAADGGYDTLKKLSLKPDILLGDFDSIENMPHHDNIIKYPTEKDDTDTFLAYRYAFEKGYRNFIIFGGIGGRIDHTIANLQMLANIAISGGRGFLIGDNTVITTISNSKMCFSSDHSGVISVFAQKGNAENVTISGLKYCAENILLKPEIPLGVSNKFTGNRAEVSVERGTLLIIWQEKTENFLLNKEDYFIG